jgi:hypothetical protein
LLGIQYSTLSLPAIACNTPQAINISHIEMIANAPRLPQEMQMFQRPWHPMCAYQHHSPKSDINVIQDEYSMMFGSGFE